MTLSEQLVEHFSPTAPAGLLGATFKLKSLIKLGTTQELRPGISIVWPDELTWRFSYGVDGSIAVSFDAERPTLTVPVPVIGNVQAEVIGLTLALDVKQAVIDFHFQKWPSFTVVLTFDN